MFLCGNLRVKSCNRSGSVNMLEGIVTCSSWYLTLVFQAFKVTTLLSQLIPAVSRLRAAWLCEDQSCRPPAPASLLLHPRKPCREGGRVPVFCYPS